MNGIIKWVIKSVLTAMFWVFILSITVEGRSLFSYANEVLVQNSIVRSVDEQLAKVWDDIVTTVTAARDNPDPDERI